MVSLVLKDRRIIFVKSLFEGVCPDPVEFTELFANKSVKRRVRLFLRATFDDHVHELNLDKTDWFFVYKTKSKKKWYGLLDPPAIQF